MSDQILWFASRGSGIVSLVLSTAVVCLGILTVVRWQSPGWPRFLTVALHRRVALLSIVFLAIHIGKYCGGVCDTIARWNLRFPDHVAVGLIESDNRGCASAGSGNYFVSVDERRFTVSPSGDLAAEIGYQALLPALLAIRKFQTDEISAYPNCV